MKNKLFRTIVVLALLLVTFVPTALADSGTDTSALRAAVTVANIRAHQDALQAIANANDGTRVASSPGYDASAAYVQNLVGVAGYQVSIQNFEFPFFEEISPSVLEQVEPNAVAYIYGDDFQTMEYSSAGDVTGPVQAVDLLLPPTGGSTSGCEEADFEGFTAGNIALIQRGTCFFIDKVLNAEAAGASGVIIFNEGNAPDREGLILGTLGEPVSIPVLDATFALGSALNDLIDDGLVLHMAVNAISETRSTMNVIADTPGGRSDRMVVVGAHLDSVAEGPGINDNGSGSAVILQIALQMAELGIEPTNKVRFIWFGAEEAGLHGSNYYVSQLSKRDLKNTAVMLNFDMVGSPNYVRFVYDGDGSAFGTAGPVGSNVVERVFLDYFALQSLATEPTAFDGRSDYFAFINAGIPAGGLFTGAEGIKTEEQEEVYGGTAGVAYDPCYHQACDTFDNNNNAALDEMSDAAAHAVLTFAMTSSAVSGTDKGKGGGAADFDYLGSHLRR